MKIRLKKLVLNTHLIDFMPFGSIERLAKQLNKDRGTVRGVLQGKWVNLEIIKGALEIIDRDVKQKRQFLETFKEEFSQIESLVKPKSK